MTYVHYIKEKYKLKNQKIVLERDSGTCEKVRTRKFLARNFCIE